MREKEKQNKISKKTQLSQNISLDKNPKTTKPQKKMETVHVNLTPEEFDVQIKKHADFWPDLPEHHRHMQCNIDKLSRGWIFPYFLKKYPTMCDLRKAFCVCEGDLIYTLYNVTTK